MSTQAKEKCPLCLETMDLTDKQLKPCKCGYEICLWCWHHIMEMDQKDECGGRCPGCRSVYNKNRIIGTSIGNQILKDLCADNSNLQQEQTKSQKQRSAKSQLRVAAEPLDPNIVRVIQKKLVYIVGVPSEFASEKVLRQKSFLGQYGKIKNIIIDNIGANQQIPDSGRVYVTFSREEEAILCIEAVNGFILDGRPLKATFGVTRYCHVWLSNKVCQKANCSYVHQKAPAEDICTKDDVAVVCVRLQHLLGMDMKGPQQRSGCTLPSPGDCHSRTTLGNGNSKDKICLNKQLASNDDKSEGNGISDSKQMTSAVNVAVDTSWRKPRYANVVSQQSSGPGRLFTVLTRELTSTDTRSKATGQVGSGISNSKKLTLPKGEHDDRITVPKCQNVKVVSRRPEEPSHKWTKQLSSAVVKSNAGAEEKSACSDITDNPVQGKHMQLSLSTASASSTALQSLSGSATMLSNLSSSGVRLQISVGSDKLSDSHIKLASESQPQILNQRKAAVSDKGVASTSDSHGIRNNQVVSTDGKHQTSAQGRDRSLYNREMTLSGDKISTEHAESILLPKQVSVLSSTDILAKDSKGRKRLVCPPGFKELHLSFDSSKDVSVSSSTCSALCSTSDALVQDSFSTADQPDIISWVSECLEDEGDTTQSNSVSISSTLTSTHTIQRPAQLHGSCFSASNQCLLSPYPGCLLQCMGGVQNPVRSCCTFPSISSTPNQMPEYWNGSANNYMAPWGYDAFCQNTTSGMKAGMVGTLLQQSSPPGLYTDWTNGSTYPGLNSAQVDLSYPMYTLF